MNYVSKDIPASFGSNTRAFFNSTPDYFIEELYELERANIHTNTRLCVVFLLGSIFILNPLGAGSVMAFFFGLRVFASFFSKSPEKNAAFQAETQSVIVSGICTIIASFYIFNVALFFVKLIS